MTFAPPKSIVLESLKEGILVISGGSHCYFLERCLFSLDMQGHKSGAMLCVNTKENGTAQSDQFAIEWSTAIDDSLRRRNADVVRSTEYSACGLAFLVIRELTSYTAIEEAPRGTTVDYYLSSKDRDDDLIFNHTARLEVSGIARGDTAAINSRIQDKTDRLINHSLPAYIIVVEHSAPVAHMVVKP